MFPSYRNQSVDLLCKSTDWFLYMGTLAVKGLKKVKMGKPLNSTERSRKRREAIYKNKVLHNALKKEERVCKNTENALNKLKRETDEELRENYRKQRDSNRRYREKIKQMKQNQAIKFSTLQKKEIKNMKLLYIDSLCLFCILLHVSFLFV